MAMTKLRVLKEYLYSYPDLPCRQVLAEVLPTFVHMKAKEWWLITASCPSPKQGVTVLPADRDGRIRTGSDPILKVNNTFDLTKALASIGCVLEENPKAEKVKLRIEK